MGSNVARELVGGAEAAPRCRLGGGRPSGSRPGGPSDPLAMDGVSGTVTAWSAGNRSPTLRYHESR
eukprot:14971322-Alexandrium_andersonii.AAC.1